jgi:hypothetical protein
VADIGCGHGGSTALIPGPTRTRRCKGSHDASIECARWIAAAESVPGSTEFAVASAKDFRGEGHDMGDPWARCATSARRSTTTAP